MKQIIKITLISLLLISFMYSDSLAQRGRNRYKRIYNPATVETVSGTVTEVDVIDFDPGTCYGGTHFKLNTGKETIIVHAGPTWFLNDNNFTILVNDNMEVKGSRVTYNGEQVIIAAYIKSGGKTLTLRSDDGTPLWSGQGRNRN